DLATTGHRRQRGDPKLRDIAPDEQLGTHVGDDAGLLTADEMISAAQTWPVQQRINRDRRALRAQLIQPELDESGKLLFGRCRGIHRYSAGRTAILILLAGAAEITGPLERQPIR